MSVFTHEKIEIVGLPMLKSLMGFKVEIKADEHGILLLEGYGEEGSDEEIIKAAACETIEVWALDEELKRLESPVFCGVITDYEVDINEQVNKLKIKALTGSYQLDLEKKSRSFQDVTMTYKDVVKEVLNGSGGNILCSIGGDRQIGKPLIQYHETDWEFIKRLASHFNSKIIADTKSTKPNVWFGINEYGENVQISDAHYTVGVSENYYKSDGISHNARHGGFIYYEVKSNDNFFIGDKTTFRSSNLLVCEKVVLQKVY